MGVIISKNAANKMSMNPVSGKRRPPRQSLLCWNIQRQNILKGCTQPLPVLLWQNDHPAMPNVDQEREISIAQGEGILGNTMPAISHYYIR